STTLFRSLHETARVGAGRGARLPALIRRYLGWRRAEPTAIAEPTRVYRRLQRNRLRGRVPAVLDPTARGEAPASRARRQPGRLEHQRRVLPDSASRRL